MAVFLSTTLQITQWPPSAQMSPGNESPAKQFVTTQTLSVARALGIITTKPVTKYSCSKANLHTVPWNSGAVSEKLGGAGERGRRCLTRGALVIQDLWGKLKCRTVCSMTGCVCTQTQSGCVQRCNCLPCAPGWE